MSSRPLIDHICAMCGGLLQPGFGTHSSIDQTGKPGKPCQVRGEHCEWYCLPPFMLLFSKELLARRLPSVFELCRDGRLLLTDTVQQLPWLHYTTRGGPGHDAPKGRMRKTYEYRLDVQNPWWFCRACYRYNHKTSANAPHFISNTRIPMRNRFEGNFTKWHADIAYPLLYQAGLYKIYPHVPPPDDVLAWRRAKEAKNELCLHHSDRDPMIQATPTYKTWMEWEHKAESWAPPAHLSTFGSPIPRKFFTNAVGKKWCLWTNLDLIPYPQEDLVQDISGSDVFQKIRSADARACIALCRPKGQFIEKRSLGKCGTRATFMHQSGALPLQPLLPSQDAARGMFSTVVTSKNFRKDLFELKPGEEVALAEVLPWLRKHNPWHGAYKASLDEVNEGITEILEKFHKTGHALPGGVGDLPDASGRTLAACLEKEEIGLLIPFKTLNEYAGTYQHHRAAAQHIFDSELRSSLPDAWKELQDCEILDATAPSHEKKPMWKLPEPMRRNLSFTKVSWRDIHVESKTFVLQHRYGTGGLNSTSDCISNAREFHLARFWSLCGEFLDDVDPQWIFWVRERKYKDALNRDLRFGFQTQTNASVKQPAQPTIPGTTVPSRQRQPVQGELNYAAQRFSSRVGRNIPDSTPALIRVRNDWLELAKRENLGPPHCMTTYVGNPRASAVVAHIKRGPLERPNPEDSLSFMDSYAPELPSTRFGCIKTADYLRRRYDFEQACLRIGLGDSLHGEIMDGVRRTEGQKRGDEHDHYILWARECGHLFSSTYRSKSQRCEEESSCNSISRWCLRTDSCCRLPSTINGSEPHVSSHLAYFQAELVRPYPLGSATDMPGDAPKNATQHQTELFSSKRLRSTNTACCKQLRAFWPRMRIAVSSCPVGFPDKYSQPMSLGDIVIAYYFRTLQAKMHIHTCIIGYCKRVLGDACRWDLPAMTPNHVQRLDPETNRVLPIRRHLPDDRWLKVHSLPILIRTLCNIQTNLHHPNAENNSLGYSLKYGTKDEPKTRIQISEYSTHAATEYLDAQFISLPMAAADVLGNRLTWSSRKVLLIIPSWNSGAGNLEWRLYLHRMPSTMLLPLDAKRPLLGEDAVMNTLRMLRMQQLGRYFPLHASSSSCVNDAEVSGEETERQIRHTKATPDAFHHDKFLDKPSHPDFEPVLSSFHEGDKLTLSNTDRQVMLRRQSDDKLSICRFFNYGQTVKRDTEDRTERSKHFEIRLFRTLNWHPWPTGAVPHDTRVISYLPQGLSLSPGPFANLLDVIETAAGQAFTLPRTMTGPSKECAKARYAATETICCRLEAAFAMSGRSCVCCQEAKKGTRDACEWCVNAIGWHRCQKDVVDSSSLASGTLWKWKPGSLWAYGYEDTKAYVIQMMQEAKPLSRILEYLQKMRIQYEEVVYLN